MGEELSKIDRQIGRRIANVRQAAGLTVRELARQLGWPYTTLSNYEVGRRPLTLRWLYEIATALECSAASFLVDPPEAAVIVEAIDGDLERCLQVQMILDALAETPPDLIEVEEAKQVGTEMPPHES